MNLRTALLALIVLATIGFVVGTTIERHDARHESALRIKAEGTAPTSSEGRGESAAQHAAETGATTPATSESGAESPNAHRAEGATPARTTATHRELRPLGIDIEAVPFVVLVALVSLALAAGAWARPRMVGGLVILALAMIVFGAVDLREVFHQSDEAKTGLEILAAVIAALHLTAAAVAIRMATGARTPTT